MTYKVGHIPSETGTKVWHIPAPYHSSWQNVSANKWLLIKSMSDSEEPSVISEDVWMTLCAFLIRVSISDEKTSLLTFTDHTEIPTPPDVFTQSFRKVF